MPSTLARWLAAGLCLLAAAACRRDAPGGGDAHAGSPAQAASEAPADRFDAEGFRAAVDEMGTRSLEEGPVAGLSIAVARRGEVVLARGYGHADREAGLPATADTSYPVASLSKMFTAAALVQLAERGRISLEDPLGRLLPDVRGPLAQVPLRRLLDHTSGLAVRGGPSPRGKALAAARRGRLASEPGREWEYSNPAFAVAGLVVEQVTGRDYAEYVRAELAVPAGMASTGYCEGGAPVPNRTRDYGVGAQGLAPTTYWQHPKFFAAGGLCSSVNDLLKWQRALAEGTVVSKAGVEAMRRPATVAGGIEVGYGLGMRLGETAGRVKVGHTGGGTSNKAVLAWYPQEDVTIAVLLNTEAGRARVTAMDLEDRIARLLFALPEPSEAVPLPADQLGRYTGAYDEGGRPTRVVTQAGSLHLIGGFDRRGTAPLLHQGGEHFVTEQDRSDSLRFLLQGAQAHAYLRYNEGWFVELGRRVGEAPPSPRPRPRRSRSRR